MANLAAVRAALALSDERTRRGLGWVLALIFAPLILLAALLCALGSGASSHNAAVVEWCFHGGALPSGIPEEYAAYMEDMRGSFALLDELITEINEMTEGEGSLRHLAAVLRRTIPEVNPGADYPEPGSVREELQ